MNNKAIIFFCLTVLILISCNTIEHGFDDLEEVPLIIVLGQSNAQGYASIDTSPQWLKDDIYVMSDYFVWNNHLKSFDVYHMGINDGTEVDKNYNFGFDIFFAEEYTKKYNSPLF